ncbi:hypothetical protein PC116_g23620 [Phytophthora cactorum]|nr:hypothetical protein Pcac1_g17396 [Phytophthora cactorum]KAG2881394.1 hypothetical protein PC114_g21575 [Phytophthora cactorum]KAG2991442.1 hypothetical protein PC119_g18897 [Phytophthora cactorum]KAG3000942.1 hypothetical protein PC120_g20574 [Phytophthora cactorum]KAG3169364.1 hypothetical protein C6341_g11108 [Phytophthora cactorum]
MSMDKYLEDVEDHRRQLNNMNNPTSDADIASVITTGPIASSYGGLIETTSLTISSESWRPCA